MNRLLQFWPLALVFVLVGILSWATDFVTLKGERTIYTADCQNGTWTGNQCTGTMTAGKRYRFRALKEHGEVLFWIAGSAERSGRMAPCEIANGRNWTCKPGDESPRSITLAMSKGHPAADASATSIPFHEVSKVTWLFLYYGSSREGNAGKS